MKYEYTIVVKSGIPSQTLGPSVIEEMDALSEAGWEVFQVSRFKEDDNTFVAELYCKRPKA